MSLHPPRHTGPAENLHEGYSGADLKAVLSSAQIAAVHEVLNLPVRYHTHSVMVWYGMIWYGMVWYGMVWYGVVEVCQKGYLVRWAWQSFHKGFLVPDVFKRSFEKEKLRTKTIS